jgi:hypothetical protein
MIHELTAPYVHCGRIQDKLIDFCARIHGSLGPRPAPQQHTHHSVHIAVSGGYSANFWYLVKKRSNPDIDVLSAVAKLAGEDQGMSALDMDSCIQSFKEKVLSAIWRKRRGKSNLAKDVENKSHLKSCHALANSR